jgi:Suppressor of fused protein (SUFU)
MSFLEDAWEQREEKVYKELFKDTGPGIYPLDTELFQSQFNYESVDPRWLHLGVFKCPPSGDRKTWLYVTSGMSNPWETDEPQEYSGYGTEFVLETAEESDWAINVLRSLIAFNILLAIGHFGDKPLLDYGDRIPFSLESNIAAMLVTEPKDYPITIELMSGKVDLLQIVGITQSELEHAKENGSDKLSEMLLSSLGSFITDRERNSVVS